VPFQAYTSPSGGHAVCGRSEKVCKRWKLTDRTPQAGKRKPTRRPTSSTSPGTGSGLGTSWCRSGRRRRARTPTSPRSRARCGLRTSGGRSRRRSMMRWLGRGWRRTRDLWPGRWLPATEPTPAALLLRASEFGGRNCTSRDCVCICPARMCPGGHCSSPAASRVAVCWWHPSSGRCGRVGFHWRTADATQPHSVPP
jgi:hypothetical protein